MFGGGGSITTSGSTPTPESALTVQTSLQGSPIGFLYGTNRIGWNLIYKDDFLSVAQTQTSSASGGKSGGGGGSQTTVSGYKYYSTLIMALCAGPIEGVLTVWKDKDNLGGLSAIGASLFTGALGQAPWSYLQSAHADKALGYSGLAYAAGANMYLGESASMPTWTMEACGKKALTYGGDANPADIIADFLTDPYVSVGFPASIIDDLTVYRTWCANLGLLISPTSNSQTATRDYLTTWLDATCANAFWSSGKIKIMPYGDANPSAFTGSLAPVWSFSNADYMPDDGEMPVEQTIVDPSNLYNRFTIEYADRSNDYNASPATSDDPAHINRYGMRAEGTQTWHFITSGVAAQVVADLRRNRQLGVPSTYVFKIGALGALFEPMDIIALTEVNIGLSDYPVRIRKIEEVDDSKFEVTAEDVPGDMAMVASRPLPTTNGYKGSYGKPPGSINSPVIFEPPLSLAGDLEVWIAASSDNAMWGGCHIWLSTDGSSYSRVGTISASARQGALSAPLASGASMDSANGLAVALESVGTLTSVSDSDWAATATLSYVDGELIAYQSASLVSSGLYLLSNLRRGLYGTAIFAHAVGSSFARLDDTVFKYPVSPDQVGKTVTLKFTSFNVFGAAEEDIADVVEYSWRVTGSALTTRLPEVANLTTNYIAGILQFSWDAYTDGRTLDTEIRIGKSWSSGQVLGRFSGTSAPTWGDGTYWVSAHYIFGSGSDAIELYSPTPIEIVVAGSQLVRNVIAAYDEAASGWSGTLTGLMPIPGGKLELCGAGDIEGAANVLAVPDVIGYGGMITTGIYQVPASHRVNIGRVAACPVAMTVSVAGDSIYDNVLTITDITQLADVAGDNYGPAVSAIPQLRLSQDGVTWGAWQNWVAGSYSFMAMEPRLLVSSSATDVTAIVSGFSFLVDVPDRVDSYTVTSAVMAVPVIFSPAFNGGPAEGDLPALSLSIIASGSPGDTVQADNLTLNGCDVIVYDATHTAVAGRTVHLIPQGY